MLLSQYSYGNNNRLKSISTRNGAMLLQQPKSVSILLSMKTVARDSGGGEWRNSKSKKTQKQKSTEAAMKHALAERKRRRRINGHLKRLRELILPNVASKTVKALILTETICQVIELKQKLSDVALQHDRNGWCNYYGTSRSFLLLGKSDEATMGYCNGGDGKIVKAEVVMQWQEGSGGNEDVGSLRRALNTLVESRASGCLGHLTTINSHSGLGLEIPTNKRAGICGSLEHAEDLEKLLLKT
ncbi:unnamed protein product [Camellia sinensis]